MNKGLEAITSPVSTELRNGKQYYIYTKEDIDTVEEELKRLKELKEKYTSLERAFNSLSKDDEKSKKLLSKEIEKNRALEILKKNLIFLLIGI